MKNNEIYELETSLSDIDLNISDYKLKIADLIRYLENTLLGTYGKYENQPIFTREKIEEKLYRKGIISELKKLGFKTQLSDMSLEEKHDYLKLLCFLVKSSFVVEEARFSSVIVQARNMKFSISDEDNSAYYIKYLGILKELEKGILNQSTKSDNSSLFYSVNSLFDFQCALKVFEMILVNDIQYNIKDKVNLYKHNINKIIGQHQRKNGELNSYTIMEQAYIYFSFQIIRAIFHNKKDAIERIRQFDDRYNGNDIPDTVIQYYRKVYLNYMSGKAKDFMEYKSIVEKFFDDNLDNLADVLSVINKKEEADKYKEKISKNKNMIVNMVLASVEQIDPEFEDECQSLFVIPASYLILTSFCKDGRKGRIIDMKQIEDISREDISKESNRITKYLKEYKKGKFSSCYAEIISNMLFYGHALLSGTTYKEKACWDLEIYISDIFLDACSHYDIYLINKIARYVYEVIKELRPVEIGFIE